MQKTEKAEPESADPHTTDAAAKKKKESEHKWRRYSPLIVGILLLAAVIFFSLHIGEASTFVELVRNASPFWLLMGVIYQIGTYLCSGAIWHVVLKRFDVKVSLGSLAELSLAKLSIEKFIPAAGIGGSLLLIRGLEGRGASGPVAAAALLIDVLSIYAARAISIAIAVGILWANKGLNVPVLIVCALFAFFSAVILGAVFWLTRIETNEIPKWITRIPGVGSVVESLTDAPPEAMKDKRLLWQAILLQFAIIVLDALTLDAMLRSIGYSAKLHHTFASFSMSSVASTLTLIPGGIGAFEGISVLLLRLLKVPIEASLAATLMLRAFILWLPMIPGFFVLRRESKHMIK